MEHDITVLLDQWRRGDETALHRLAPLVYPQLREIAAGYLRRERAGHTLQATALVSELFLKLMSRREANFQNRRHFYVLTAKLMRMALIDHSRSVNAEKRGGESEFVPLHEDLAWANAAGPMMIDLDRALDELAALDKDQAEMFEMRFLVGCTTEETAVLLQVSRSSVDRKVRLARAWLFRRLAAAEAKHDPDAPHII